MPQKNKNGQDTFSKIIQVNKSSLNQKIVKCLMLSPNVRASSKQTLAKSKPFYSKSLHYDSIAPKGVEMIQFKLEYKL